MSKKNESTPSLRSYEGKKLLSYLREGDYAHAGETESIEIVMSEFSKKQQRKILDVGCGLGGTANFIQLHHWGKVTGLDIEPEAIQYAKKHYPEISFYCADVIQAPDIFQDKNFDLLCLFNSFYAFKDQALALKVLSDISLPNATLAIFDYSDKSLGTQTFPPKNFPMTIGSFTPINLNKIESMLASNGWRLYKLDDISDLYIGWYSSLLEKIVNQEKWIISYYGEAYYHKAENTYRALHQALVEQSLGGAIVYAENK